MFNFEVCAYLFEIKEGENFNHRNTCSISRIALKLHWTKEDVLKLAQKSVAKIFYADNGQMTYNLS